LISLQTLPDAVLKRLGRRGGALAVKLFGALLACGSIGPYILEIVLYRCLWPWKFPLGKKGKFPPPHITLVCGVWCVVFVYAYIYICL
jgi:hypothetical protein